MNEDNENRELNVSPAENDEEVKDTFCIECGRKNCPRIDTCPDVDLE